MTAALTLAFDELEEAEGERIGATLDEVTALLRSLETRILATPADAPDALAWKVRRLARAIENEWRDAHVIEIVRSIESVSS